MHSVSSITLLACLAVSFTFVTPVKHEFTIYSDRIGTGNSITFREKVPNLSQWRFFLTPFTERLYCSSGSWGFYSGANYSSTIKTTGFSTDRICITQDFNLVESLRFFGPPDTSTESISFYEGTFANPTRGTEVTLLPGNDFIEYMPFVPTALVATGNSSWTLYSGGNFTGRATCYQSGEFSSQHLINGTFYLSVRKGCDDSVDEHVILE